MAGGIPIIAAITECLTANQIESIHAILNGTSNFILSPDGGEQHRLRLGPGRGPATRLRRGQSGNGRQRQRRRSKTGHPGPSGLRRRVNWRDIPRTGIDVVDVADIRYARELGYSIKLLAVAELVPEGLELHVSPTLVRHDSGFLVRRT